MVESELTQIGMAGALAILIVREVLDFVRRRQSHDPDWRVLERQIAELHEWHAKEDTDGVKVWYVRRSLEEAFHELSETTKQQSTLFDRLINRLDQQSAVFERLVDKIEKMDHDLLARG